MIFIVITCLAYLLFICGITKLFHHFLYSNHRETPQAQHTVMSHGLTWDQLVIYVSHMSASPYWFVALEIVLSLAIVNTNANADTEIFKI